MPTNPSPASPSVSPIEEVGAARRREIAFQLSGLPRFNARAYREGKQCMWQHPGGVYVRWVDVVNFIESWNRCAPASLAQRSDDRPSVGTSLRRDPEPPTQAVRDEIQSRYFPTTTGRECERCKQPMSAFEDDGESDLCLPCARNLAHAFMAARLTSGGSDDRAGEWERVARTLKENMPMDRLRDLAAKGEIDLTAFRQ